MMTRADVEEKHYKGEAEEGYFEFHNNLGTATWFAQQWYYVKPKPNCLPMAYDRTEADKVRELIHNGGRWVEKVSIYKDDKDWSKHDATIIYDGNEHFEEGTHDEVGDFFIKATKEGRIWLVFQNACTDIPRVSMPEIWCCGIDSCPSGLYNIPAAIADFISR